MEERRNWNTKFYEKDGEKYCVYCGKKMSVFTDEMASDYYNCDCLEADKEYMLNMQISELQFKIQLFNNQLPEPNFICINNEVFRKTNN